MANLWTDTPGEGFTNKFAVLLLGAKTHEHGPAGHLWVTFNDAVGIAHNLDKARREVENAAACTDPDVTP